MVSLRKTSNHTRIEHRPSVVSSLIMSILAPGTFACGCAALCMLAGWPQTSTSGDGSGGLELLAATAQAVGAAGLNVQTTEDLESKMLADLESDLPLAEKKRIFEQLRLVATPRAVPVLARMLSDTNLSHSARSVLEVLPGQTPGMALSRALTETRRNNLIGVISALGNRRSRDAVPALSTLLTNSEVPVVTAAVSALGKIGSDDALVALRGVACAIDPPLLSSNTTSISLAPRVRYRLNMGVVLDALLECAEVAKQQSRTNAAAQLCAELAATETAPWPGRIAAIKALATLDSARAMPFVLDLLRQNDRSIQLLGASLVRNMPQPALESLFTILYACPTTAQIGVIESLADRGEPTDAALLLKATRYPDPHVQAAAARSLAGFSPSIETVKRLAELASLKGPQADAAVQALATMEGENADNAILASLDSANEPVLVGLIRAVSHRGLEAALPAVVRATSAENPMLRSAAIEALGRLGGRREFALLEEQLVKASSGTTVLAIAEALTEIARRTGTQEPAARVMAGLLPSAERQTRLGLYDCLARMGGTTALNAVRQATASEELEIKEKALKLLANWPDASALDELIAIAKIEYIPSHRSIVLHGLTNLIARPSTRSPEQTFTLYAQALQVALTPDEKKLLFPGLARLGLPEARNFLTAYLSDPDLRNEARECIAKSIVDLLFQSPAQARQELAQFRSANIDQQLRADLETILLAVANAESSTNTWLTAGPYTRDGADIEELIETPFPPEEPTAVVQWTQLPRQAPMLILNAAPARANQIVYLSTCIIAEREQNARLCVLAATPVRVWLNHVPTTTGFAGSPHLKLQQITDITLRKGENKFLVKLPVASGKTAFGCYIGRR